MHEDADVVPPLKYVWKFARPLVVSTSPVAPSNMINAGIPRIANFVDNTSFIRNLCRFANGTFNKHNEVMISIPVGQE
jgi:hypothetical protein